MSPYRAQLPGARTVGNSFEERARREKVARLVNVLDLACVEQLKLDPITQARDFAVRLAVMGESGWEKAAKIASVNVPSPTTRAAVIDSYYERARLAGTVAS